MATFDFTETPAVDRDSATRINPFIGCIDQEETQVNIRAGLAALSMAIGSTGTDSIGDQVALGLQLFTDTLRAAQTYDINNGAGGAL